MFDFQQVGFPPGVEPRRVEHPIADATDAAAVRRRLPAAIGDSWLAPSLDAVSLVSTELIVNAWCHGQGPREFRLLMSDGLGVAAVFDQGPAQPRFELGPPPDDGCGGRGLRLVRALTDGHGVIADGSGKWVFALWSRSTDPETGPASSTGPA